MVPILASLAWIYGHFYCVHCTVIWLRYVWRHADSDQPKKICLVINLWRQLSDNGVDRASYFNEIAFMQIQFSLSLRGNVFTLQYVLWSCATFLVWKEPIIANKWICLWESMNNSIRTQFEMGCSPRWNCFQLHGSWIHSPLALTQCFVQCT